MGCASSKPEENPGPKASLSRSLPSDKGTTELSDAVLRGSSSDLSKLLAKMSMQDAVQRNAKERLLHQACALLHAGCVDVLLAKGVYCDVRDEAGRNPLHVLILEAAKHDAYSAQAADALDIMRKILQHAATQGRLAELDVHDSNFTPLLLAVATKQENLASELIAANASLSSATLLERNNILHLSVTDVGQLRDMLQAASDQRMTAKLVNEPNIDGNTPLHLALLAMCELHMAPVTEATQQQHAAGSPLSAAATILMDKGCFIDVPNKAGQTAVSLAVDCATGAMEIGAGTGACTEVLLTIAKGQVAASPDIFNKLGHSGKAAIHVAAQLGHIDLLTCLEARGARMDLPDKLGQLPAVITAQADHKPALKHMLGNLKADALARDHAGQSAAAAILLNPAFSPLDVKELLRIVIHGWGEQQCQAALPVLCLACQRGNVEAVKLLVLEGMVEVRGTQGMMPLMSTVQAHCVHPSQQLVKVAEFLMQQGANPVAEDNIRATALGTALGAGHLDIAMAMLRTQSQHVNHVAPNGHTALFLAIRTGYTAVVRELVSFTACTGPRPGLTYIPLHVAVEYTNPEIVRILINTEQGRQAVAVKDSANKSVLDYLWASWSKAVPPGKRARPEETQSLVDIAQLLLLHRNCDVNALDKEGMRPMHWAVRLNEPRLIELLSKRGMDVNPNLPDGEGVTPLFRAAQRGNDKLVETMLNLLPTLDLGARSCVAGVEQGGTVLQAAVAAGNVKLVRAMINRRGVQVDRRSFDLCLNLAQINPAMCAEIMGELLQTRANGGISLAGGHARDAQPRLTTFPSGDSFLCNGALDVSNLPPLHQVVCCNSAALVQLLVVQADANVDERDVRGMTPLHHAVERKAYEAASKLVNLGARVSELSYGPMGTTPLIAAVNGLDTQMVKDLLKSATPLDVNTLDGRGQAAFTVALRKLLAPPKGTDAQIQRVVDSAMDIAQRLLRAGADCNKPMLTARMWASRDQDGPDSLNTTGTSGGEAPPSSALNFALAAYAMDEDQLTPLLAAISLGSVPVVQMLLPNTSVEVNGFQGSPPAIHMALRCVQAATAAPTSRVTDEHFAFHSQPSNPIRMLTAPHAKRHTPPSKTALADARSTAVRILRLVAQEDRVDLMQPSPWQSGPDGSRPSVLIQLVSIGGPDAVELVRDLLACGRELSINAADPVTGETALHVAAARGDCAMLEVLMGARGVDLNALDKKGRSPLACAVAYDCVFAVRSLLAKGLDNKQARAPLDLNACGPDLTSSAMAHAMALPSVHCLEALLGRSRRQSHQGFEQGPEVYVVVGVQPSNGGKSFSGYDINTLVNSPVDASGRPPVVVAMSAYKFEHVRLLIEAGAKLNVHSDALAPPLLMGAISGSSSTSLSSVPPTPLASTPSMHYSGRGPNSASLTAVGPPSSSSTSSAFAWPSGTPANAKNPVSGTPGPPTVPPTPGLGNGVPTTPANRTVLSTPFSMLCHYIRNLESTKDKETTKVEQAKALAVLMANQESFDVKDGSELQWAVMSRNVTVVEAVAARAKSEGCMDVKAMAYKNQKFTALDVAVQLELTAITKVLLQRGAMPDAGTLALVAKSKSAIKELFKSVPVQPSNGFICEPPVQRPLDPEVDPNANYLEPIAPVVPLNPTTPEELYQTFHTMASLAVGTCGGPAGGFAPAAVANVLEAVRLIGDSLLGLNLKSLVLHRACVQHMLEGIRNQLPTLVALKDVCERRADNGGYGRGECVSKDVVQWISKLGELYVQIHRNTANWCTTDKATLIKRMLSTNEYKDIQHMQTNLRTYMMSLATAVDACHMLPDPVLPLYTLTTKELDQQVKTVIQNDMKSEMYDLHSTVIIMGTDAQIQAGNMFTSFGLQYNRTVQRWLRETVFPSLVIKYRSLEVVRKVGSGAMATVYLVNHHSSDGNIQQRAFKRFDGALPGAAHAVSCEGFVLSTLDHPNVLRLYGIVIDKEHCGLVVDYHENGSLQQLIQPRDGSPLPPLVKRVALALQIAKGMAYLHGHSLGSIVHGDLKPSNILIASRDSGAIIDFGLSSGMARGWTATHTGTTTANQHQGSSDASAVYYQAPEVLQQLLAGKKREVPSDMFAFGVLLFELMTLKPVRTDFARDPADFQNKVERGDRPLIPADLHPMIVQCIKKCWAQEPLRRLAFATVVDKLTIAYKQIAEAV